MESIECTSCHRRFNDATLLSLHHQYEYCSNSNLICPICDKLYPDPLVLEIHINEEHDYPTVHNTQPSATTVSDQLYAQELERRERMKINYEQRTDSFEDEDARIARLLQEEENAQSFEEFQNRYGGSTRTFSERARWNLEKIYKRKAISEQNYNEYKAKLDDMIAQPVERMESRSTGIIPVLSRLPMGNVLERRLCRPACDHMSSTWLDQGWSCGYKNFQMLLSSLRHDPEYSTHLFGQNNQDIPSVSYLQNLIERAWSAGFDSQGREQLNGRLVNSTKWIGPTELMACLGNLNIKTELFDFHQPKNLEKNVAYKYLFEWIRNYFQRQAQQNYIHPLYLQHEGHSRTIVGYEQLRNGNIRLLIFDPSTSKTDIDNFMKNPSEKAFIFRRSLQAFQKSVYQILVIRGLLNPNEREAAKQLRSTKVPLP